MSKYRVFSGPYFPVFGLNTGKYGPEKTPYLDTFHAVEILHSKCVKKEKQILKLIKTKPREKITIEKEEIVSNDWKVTNIFDNLLLLKIQILSEM